MSDTRSGAAAAIPSYDDFTAEFTAAQVEAKLAGSLERGLNACVECCDRHAQSGRVALFWETRTAAARPSPSPS